MDTDFFLYIKLRRGTLQALGRHAGLPLLKLLNISLYAENESGCHRGYKPLLHGRRSGDLPSTWNSAQHATANSTPFNKKLKLVLGLTNFMCNRMTLNKIR
jgi:hypothetical protein